MGIEDANTDFTLDMEFSLLVQNTDNVISLFKSLCKTIKLYHEKIETYFFIMFNPEPTTEDYTIETLNTKMLDALTYETLILKSSFDNMSDDSLEIDLLPYRWINASELYTEVLESVRFFEYDDDQFFDTPSQKEALEKTREAMNELRKSIKRYESRFINDDDTILKRFEKMMQRYELENQKQLDSYIKYINEDVKMVKRKLGEKYKDEPGVKCWLMSDRNIVNTIREMYKQRREAWDLLKLLEYKAKYDRLTERDNDDKQHYEREAKDNRGRNKGTLFKNDIRKGKECKRVKGYLQKHKLQDIIWSSGKDDTITKVTYCFAQCWKEREYIDEGYDVMALVRFMLEDCGVQTGVLPKTLANKIRVKKNSDEKIDERVLEAVGAEFKNELGT